MTMSNRTAVPSQVWSIVLGGGDGGRMTDFIQRWLGHPRPKQYCTFFGERSLFQHTLDRASALCRQEHIVTLVAREHGHEAWSQLEGRGTGTILLQPKNRDSAAGVYLSLTYLRAKDPQATVVIYPSDHFVYPEASFLMCVHRALCTLEWRPDQFVVLGAPPDRLELDYGWIVPGEQIQGLETYRTHAVKAYAARPTLAEADAALASGALWNTSVMAARAETLWQIGWDCFPGLMPGFERLGRSIGTSMEAQILDEIYHDIPTHDLLSELLERVPERAAVVEMKGVLWSDWGKPAHIVDSLRRIGHEPAFPLDCLGRAHGRCLTQKTNSVRHE
jgi:mannose-1-phosphate guanylyltransferase